MSLTSDEKQLARAAATTQGPRGRGWGSPALGSCPLGSIVQARGGVFFRYPDDPAYHAIPLPNDPIAPGCCNAKLLSPAEREQYETLAALIDTVRTELLAWAGYPTERALLDAILAHGAAALPAEEETRRAG